MTIVRTLCFLSCLIVPALALASSKDDIGTTVPPENIRLLAIGVCPPWQAEPDSCNRNATSIAQAFRTRMKLLPENIRTVTAENATYAGLKKAFLWLSNHSGPQDTVLVYFNGHGVMVPNQGWDDPPSQPQETFVLWTEKEPYTGLSAVMSQQWITAGEFQQLINTVPGTSKLWIIDSCYSSGAENVSSVPGHPYGDNQNLAFMASSSINEPSWSYKDLSVFSGYLISAMERKGDMFAAYQEAAQSTMNSSSEFCSAQTKQGHLCTGQTPVLDDSRGLLKRLRLSDDHSLVP
jgi:caspase domain-containing protein